MKRKQNIRGPDQGLTMVELLVAMVVALLALGTIYSTFLNQHKSYVVQEETSALNQKLRIALFYMQREIRMAGCDPTGNANARIKTANAASINFTEDVRGNYDGSDSDGDTDDANEDIAYSLKANNLVKNTGGGNQMVVQNIDALDFVYLDGSSPPSVLNPKGSDVPEEKLDQIRSVEVTMVARTDRPTLAFQNNNAYFNQRGWQILEPQNEFIAQCPSLNGLFDRSAGRRSRYLNGVATFFACLPSSNEGYDRQVIFNKNPHLWMDTG